ncbi:major facilitator superfamily transporter [Podospora conica]|nr:major facilitator superfamily transporter [Schizothecium conicum]
MPGASGAGTGPQPPPQTRAVTETTPLLGDLPPSTTAHGYGQPAAKVLDDDTGEVTIIVQELSDARLIMTLMTTWVGVFLGAIDASIIATLSAPISSEFGSLSVMSWLATSYLVANAASQPLSGRLTDIFGRGPGLVCCNLLFALGNLICGLARDEKTIIIGRVIAGIGGGGLMSISTFLGSDLVPLRKRGIYQGIGNIAYGSGAMVGGVFGGFVHDATAMGWRLAFLVQVPIVLVSAVLVHILVRVPPKVSNKSLISRIDFTGSFLTIAFLVVLLLGVSAGGTLVPWSHPLVIASFPLSALLLATFLWWESTQATQPIIPVRLLLDRTILSSCISLFVSTMVMTTTTFFVPLYLQTLGYSATSAGLRLLASPVGVVFTSIGSGFVMKRTGKYVVLGIATQVVFAIGSGTLYFLNGHTPEWVPFLAMLLCGAGYGATLTVTLLACIAAVDHSKQAVITAGTYLFRSVGSTLGVTIAASLHQNILDRRLWERFGDRPGAAEEIERIRNDLGELARLPEGWYEGVIQSFMEAFRGVWVMLLGLAVVGIVSSAAMKQHKLHSTLTRQED